MNIKQSFMALSLVFASAAAVASPVITATPAKNGAWIKITENGFPVESAVVNENFVTNENGRVFIYNQYEGSQTVGFSAVTPDGEMLETRIYLAENIRR